MTYEEKGRMFTIVTNQTNRLLLLSDKLEFEDKVQFLKILNEIQNDIANSILTQFEIND